MPAKGYYILWALIGLVYLCNLPIDVMEVDAAQYASMSSEMRHNANPLHVFHRGHDYLDKPPLLFWFASASFAVFGENNIAYKLPALLVLILGLWSTYQLARLYYNQEVARMSVTILGSTQAFFLMTNDVRTDGLLTGFVIFGVYCCAAYLNKPKLRHLILAGVGIGMAMMAKGPVGAIIPAVAVAGDRILLGKWRDLLRPSWLVVILVTAVMLIPMCYGLFTQFDLHPEKSAYGLDSPSGLRFFFWTQSFGRITGEIYWDNHAPFYFFCMTFLWDFIPWTVAFFPALIATCKSLLRRHPGRVEYMTLSGFCLVFLLLSFSRYKLPHYIFPLFPFAAILTSKYLYDCIAFRNKALIIAHLIVVHLLLGILCFGLIAAFPPRTVILPGFLLLGYVAFWWSFKKLQSASHRIIVTGAITAVMFGTFMSVQFYPNLMQYQAGSQAGRAVKADKAAHDRAYYVCPRPSYSMDFYSGHYVADLRIDQLDSVSTGSWVFVDEGFYEQVPDSTRHLYHVVQTFQDYHVSMLKMKFVLQQKRQSQLKTAYLLEKN